MISNTFRRGWLDHEADRLEAAMANLAIPVRVSGGRVEEQGVRYHVTPLGGAGVEQIRAAGTKVASALGVERVVVDAAPDGVTVDVAFASPEAVRLLPLLSSLGALPAMTAVAGIEEDGVPVVLDLLRHATWHALVETARPGERSEWLRCVVACLALNSRPSELQLLGIDLTGAQQMFIEGLPHALSDVATRADDAIDLLSWLRDEAARRVDIVRRSPQLVLVVDDLSELVRQTGRVATSLLNRLLSDGREAGLHVVGGRAIGRAEGEGDLHYASGCVSVIVDRAARHAPSHIGADAGFAPLFYSARPVCLSAVDIDSLVRDVRSRRVPREEERKTNELAR